MSWGSLRGRECVGCTAISKPNRDVDLLGSSTLVGSTINIYSLSRLRHPVETDRVSSGFFSSILFATSPRLQAGRRTEQRSGEVLPWDPYRVICRGLAGRGFTYSVCCGPRRPTLRR